MSFFKVPEQGGFSAAEYTRKAQGPAPSLRRRMAAFLYEGVLLFGLVVAVGLVFSIITNQRHALDHRQGMMVTQFVALAIYFMWLWTHGGQTLALKTWQLRLVDKHGGPITLSRALTRFLLSWLWLLPPLLIAYLAHVNHKGAFYGGLVAWVVAYGLLSKLLPSGQFLHDLLSGTRIVDNRKSTQS